MKKILVVISILLISAMLTGCSLGKKAAEGQTQQASQQQETQQPTAPASSTGADNINQGISDVQKEEQNLNTDGMSDIDAGLSDIEKM